MNVFKLLMQYQSAFLRGCASFHCPHSSMGESARLPVPHWPWMLSFVFAILLRSIWVFAKVKGGNHKEKQKFKFQTINQNW